MQLQLGAEYVECSLAGHDVTVAEPGGGTPVDIESAVERAATAPRGPRLAERVDPGDDIAVVVTDVTRATPDDALLDVLLAELERGGVDREAVTVVIGLGLHRPMTDDELREALGERATLAENYDPERTVVVGKVEGCPIEVYEPVAAADTVVSTGMVEPHQYAGFSGGAKTVVIGAGGESQIGYTHGPEMLAREGVRLGRVDDNPFREFVDRAGDLVGVDFCLNVTHGPAGILGASAGDPRAVVTDLAGTAQDALAVEADEGYDAVVAGVGAPKDANLYQTTRGATYVVLGPHNPVRAGGRVVTPARLTEGAGQGTGEQRFYEWLSTAESADALCRKMREGYEPGSQRAFVVAQVLREHDLWITDSEASAVVEDCLMHAAEDVEEAVEPGSDVLVVPDALNTLLV